MGQIKKALGFCSSPLSFLCFYICKCREENHKINIIASYIPFRLFTLICLSLLIHPAIAQVKFTAAASVQKMGKGDYVEIQFAVENARKIDRFQAPDFPAFNIVQGPNQSTGMSITNGTTSQYQAVNFILQPKKAGRFTISAASAIVDGKLMRSNSLQIKVLNKSSSNTNNNNSVAPGFSPLPDPNWPTAQPTVDMEEVVRPGENVTEKIRKNFFLRTDVSKTDCYLGEPIVATYQLCARLRSDSRVTRHPTLNGFSVYDMIDPANDQVSVEKINGKNFTVHVIRKTQLIPLQPGDVVLDPVEVDNNIYLVRKDGSSAKGKQGLGGLIDRLFQPEESGTAFNENIVIESKPVTIHVKPLPDAGKPADFNGAVGQYSIQASVDSKEVDTGDAAILTVVIRGSGNLPVINAPLVDWPAGIESYDVKSKEEINKAVAPLGGTKTFSYSFICNTVGKYILPPVKLSYFDPATRSYKTVHSDTLHIQINHPVKKSHPAPLESPVVSANSNWTNYLWAIAAALLIVLIVLVVSNQRKEFRLREVEKARELALVEKEKLPVVVFDSLKESRALLASGDYGKFYAAVNRTIWKSVSDKLHLPASELNKLNIAHGLREKGWSHESIIELKSILNECEMKLYTPEVNAIDLERMLISAQGIVQRLNA